MKKTRSRKSRGTVPFFVSVLTIGRQFSWVFSGVLEGRKFHVFVTNWLKSSPGA